MDGRELRQVKSEIASMTEHRSRTLRLGSVYYDDADLAAEAAWAAAMAACAGI